MPAGRPPKHPWLTVEIRRELYKSLITMVPDDDLYQLVKFALGKTGHWKNLPRGNKDKILGLLRVTTASKSEGGTT